MHLATWRPAMDAFYLSLIVLVIAALLALVAGCRRLEQRR
jgi:hypothetical protein